MLDTEIDKTATAKPTPAAVITQLTVNQLMLLLNIYLLANKQPHWDSNAKDSEDTFKADMHVLINAGLLLELSLDTFLAMKAGNHDIISPAGHTYIRQIRYLK